MASLRPFIPSPFAFSLAISRFVNRRLDLSGNESEAKPRELPPVPSFGWGSHIPVTPEEDEHFARLAQGGGQSV